MGNVTILILSWDFNNIFSWDVSTYTWLAFHQYGFSSGFGDSIPPTTVYIHINQSVQIKYKQKIIVQLH